MRALRRIAALLPLIFCLSLLPPRAVTYAAAGPFTITTAVVGQGTVDTIEPTASIPLGTTKHYRIRPARGWMISDVQIDGGSIGPMMYASFPFVRADHDLRVIFTPFSQAAATNVSTKVKKDIRILIAGDDNFAAGYLEQMIASDPNRDFNVTIEYAGTDLFSVDGLLAQYYDRRNYIDPFSLVPAIDRGWDYIIPFDTYAMQAEMPELHMEAVRALYNRGWFFGGQARLILPMSFVYDQPTSQLARQTENVYRIAAGFRIPVVPCNIGWQARIGQSGFPADGVLALRQSAYICAAMLYAQLFERDPASAGHAPNFTNGVYPTDEDRVLARALDQLSWSTWQAEKTRNHYSGAYAGNATPFRINGGRGFHFGTSTRQLSVDNIESRIGALDPAQLPLVFDNSTAFGNVMNNGSNERTLLARNSYAYMWRMPVGFEQIAAGKTFLDTARTQFGEDPYFIWYNRYDDVPADVNFRLVGDKAWREMDSVADDNADTAMNPGRKSRASLGMVGWGRVFEERGGMSSAGPGIPPTGDIEMMEEGLAHASPVMMAMFTAQAYALITGRDASAYGAWGLSGALAEQARYTQRVGFTTIMQAGTLDINEPYEPSPYDVPIFNPKSYFYTAPASVYAASDRYVLPEGATSLSVPAGAGVLANDASTGGALTAVLKTGPDYAESFTLNPNGSFSITMPSNYRGVETFTYAVSNGSVESKPARVIIRFVPADATATATSGAPTTIDQGGVRIELPAGAVDQSTQLIFRGDTAAAGSGGLRLAGRSFTLTAYRNGAPVSPMNFLQPVRVVISYSDDDVAGHDEAALQVLARGAADSPWMEDGVTVVERDLVNNTITVEISHLTEFAIGATSRLFVPLAGR